MIQYLVSQRPKAHRHGLVTVAVVVEADSGAAAIRAAMEAQPKWFMAEDKYGDFCKPKAEVLIVNRLYRF